MTQLSKRSAAPLAEFEQEIIANRALAATRQAQEVASRSQQLLRRCRIHVDQQTTINQSSIELLEIVASQDEDRVLAMCHHAFEIGLAGGRKGIDFVKNLIVPTALAGVHLVAVTLADVFHAEACRTYRLAGCFIDEVRILKQRMYPGWPLALGKGVGRFKPNR